MYDFFSTGIHALQTGPETLVCHLADCNTRLIKRIKLAAANKSRGGLSRTLAYCLPLP